MYNCRHSTFDRSISLITYLIPNFLYIWIVLDDDGVLHIAARRCWCSVLLLMIGRAAHAAAVQEDFEGCA